MAHLPTDLRVDAEAQRILKWAGKRRCLRCGEAAPLHVVQAIAGKRGPRIALLRSIAGRVHEFDPGERRRASR